MWNKKHVSLINLFLYEGWWWWRWRLWQWCLRVCCVPVFVLCLCMCGGQKVSNPWCQSSCSVLLESESCCHLPLCTPWELAPELPGVLLSCVSSCLRRTGITHIRGLSPWKGCIGYSWPSVSTHSLSVHLQPCEFDSSHTSCFHCHTSGWFPSKPITSFYSFNLKKNKKQK